MDGSTSPSALPARLSQTVKQVLEIFGAEPWDGGCGIRGRRMLDTTFVAFARLVCLVGSAKLTKRCRQATDTVGGQLGKVGYAGSGVSHCHLVVALKIVASMLSRSGSAVDRVARINAQCTSEPRSRPQKAAS